MITAICGSGKTDKLIEIANEFAGTGKNVLMITNRKERFINKLNNNIYISLLDNIALSKIIDGANILMLDEKDTGLKDGAYSLAYLDAIGKQVYYTTNSSIIQFDDMELNDEVIYVSKSI